MTRIGPCISASGVSCKPSFHYASLFFSHRFMSFSPRLLHIPNPCGPTAFSCFSQQILAVKSHIIIFTFCDLQLLYSLSNESQNSSIICSSASNVGAYAAIRLILKGLVVLQEANNQIFPSMPG